MERYINQLECKDVAAGEVLFNRILNTNLLLFAVSGSVLIHLPKDQFEMEVTEGHFVLLPAGMHYTITAVAASHILYVHAGSLSKMIVDDPEWNPERPVALPILPALDHILRQIEYYQKEIYYKLN